MNVAFISSLLSYAFTTVIYLFIFSIIRLIYMDIKKTSLGDDRSAPPGVYLRSVGTNNIKKYGLQKKYPLPTSATVIGRGKRANIRIDNDYLSTRHLQIWYDDEEWRLEDLGSKNGTYVNDMLIDGEVLLDSGDIISVCDLEFQFINK